MDKFHGIASRRKSRNVRRTVVLGAIVLGLASCGGNRKMVTGKPPASGQAQQVMLIWVPGQKQWMVQFPGSPPVKPDQAHSRIPPGEGPTMFVVNIQGSTPATFKSSGALSAWEGDKTKPQAGINSQILGPVVRPDGKQLVFFDLNYGNAVPINYALHFEQPTIPSVDPIIDNGGGNW